MPEDPKVTNPPASASSSDNDRRRRPPAPDPEPDVPSREEVLWALREMGAPEPSGQEIEISARKVAHEVLTRLAENLPSGLTKAKQRLVGWPGSVVLEEKSSQAQQSLFRDIDTILGRLESGIAVERAAMDALLDRLTSNAK